MRFSSSLLPALLAFALSASACAPAGRTETAPVGEHNSVLNGVRLYYRVAGTAPAGAPPVLYLHGGPGYNSYSFAALVGPRLETTHRMIYLDQRGSGRSERPWTGEYALATLVEDVEALRRELNVPRLVLLGHSFGGTLALEYAARYPDRVAGLVFVDGLSDAPATYRIWKRELERRHPELLPADAAAGSDFSVVMTALGKGNPKAFFDALQFRDARHLARQDSVDAASGLRNTGELSSAVFSAELPTYRFAAVERITAPVLVIGGRYDFTVGIETLRDLAGRLPKAEFREYEDSGHFPFLEEQERFLRDVNDFTARLR